MARWVAEGAQPAEGVVKVRSGYASGGRCGLVVRALVKYWKPHVLARGFACESFRCSVR